MRCFLIVALAVLGPAPLVAGSCAQAAEGRKPAHGECLREAEIHDEVGAKRVVPQIVALRAARAAKGGEPVRARLCRSETGLVYAITALKKDGKVVHVTVDAATGKVIDPE